MESLLSRPGKKEVLCITDSITDSNCYMIMGNHSCVIIDPNNAQMITQVLDQWGKKPSLVLLTHGHCDHMSGLNEIRKRYDIQVAASEKCSLELQDVTLNMSRMMETYLYFKSGERRIYPYAPFICDRADIVFEDELVISFEDEEIYMKLLPGHTHGSSAIRYEDILYSGDYLLPDDKVVTRLPGGCEEEYEKYTKPWLKTVADNTIICPGHGKPYKMCEEMRIQHDI